MIVNTVTFIIFTLLWLAFWAAIIFSPGTLDSIWQTFLGWPLVVQIIVGILFLPLVVGLWIWESSLPFWLRLVLVIGLGIATIIVFSPRRS